MPQRTADMGGQGWPLHSHDASGGLCPSWLWALAVRCEVHFSVMHWEALPPRTLGLKEGRHEAPQWEGAGSRCRGLSRCGRCSVPLPSFHEPSLSTHCAQNVCEDRNPSGGHTRVVRHWGGDPWPFPSSPFPLASHHG